MNIPTSLLVEVVLIIVGTLISGLAAVIWWLIRDKSKQGDTKVSELNDKIEEVENKVNSIVTGDIAQLYRELATLQGDIKVLSTELKNLNTNITSLFDTMTTNIVSNITKALDDKRNS